MPTGTKTKPHTKKQRALIEAYAVGANARTGSPLEIDEAEGVIYRVRVLGRYSRNNHGLTEAQNGTEYSPACMRSALAMYENAKVKKNHPSDRSQPGKERSVDDTIGVLRNARIEADENGEPAIWADLHYNRAKAFCAELVDDVKRGLGAWGLSHNASAKRERFDSASKRLVIEELAQVRSVDLVDKPATGTNLWESEMPAITETTIRELLESRRPKWSKVRRKWADRLTDLIEDDGMAPAMDAPIEVAGGADEDDALWTGIKAAIDKLFEKFKAGELDEKGVGKQVVEYLKAHTKLTGTDEPESPPDVEEDEDEDEDGKGKKDKQESEVEKKLAAVESREKVRELCESAGVAPTTIQVKMIAGLATDKERQEAIADLKSRPTDTKAGGGGFKTPKSAPPGAIKTPAKKDGKQDRETQESEVVPAADAQRTLFGD